MTDRLTDLFTALLLHLLHAGHVSRRGTGPTSLISDYFRYQRVDEEREREREK